MTSPVNSSDKNPTTITTSNNQNLQDRPASLFPSRSEGSHTSIASASPGGTPPLPIRAFATSSNKQSLWNRVTTFFRNRLGNSHTPTNPVTPVKSSPFPISEELKSILHSWIEEAPEGEKKDRNAFYDFIIAFHSKSYRMSFKQPKLILSSLPNIFGFEVFKEIKYFHCLGYKLLELPKSIVCLQKLEKLEAGSNKLRTLPEGFGELPNLQRLSLKNNFLLELPDFLSKKLKQVDVSDNFLIELPTSLCSLEKGLLDASNNLNGYLNGCPSSSADPYHLKRIGMPHKPSPETINDLGEEDACKEALEDWIKEAPEGENRKEACNNIVSFLINPSQEYLYLGNNLRLSSLPEVFKDPRFNKLKFLDLCNNKLESLPEELINLRQLRTLDVINNKFTTLTLPLHIINRIIDQF